MLVNAEISPVREDFGYRLQCLAAYIEHPTTVTEPLFHDDELDIVNTLLAGDSATDGIAQLKDLVEKRVVDTITASSVIVANA